ncbi:hypothetical protein K503DRAFT_695218, partial [Rhizopogon vinicolor AM-OR11-026]
TIAALGGGVLGSTKSWKVGKTYATGTVQTLSRAKRSGDGAAWHSTMSQHTKEDATFNDEFWSKLGMNKAENAKECVHFCQVTLVKRISDTQSIWTIYYTFPTPVLPRVFTGLQTIHLDESSPRTGYDLLNPPFVVCEPMNC